MCNWPGSLIKTISTPVQVFLNYFQGDFILEIFFPVNAYEQSKFWFNFDRKSEKFVRNLPKPRVKQHQEAL